MKDEEMTKEHLIKEIVEFGIIEAIGDAISIQDTDFKILYQNQVHRDIVGDHVGGYCYERYEHRNEVCEACPLELSFKDGKIHQAERSAHIDKEIVYVEITASVLKDKTGKIIAGIEDVRDITKRKQMEDKLQAFSFTDELTGLYNRRGFFYLSEHQLKVAKRNKVKSFLLYADLDNLKKINDTLGHNEGDNALIDFANILRETYRNSDIIARIGGDEFVIYPVETNETKAEIIIARLQKNLKIYNENNRNYKLFMSVGITLYDPESSDTIDKLIAKADKLMYEQKKQKKS